LRLETWPKLLAAEGFGGDPLSTALLRKRQTGEAGACQARRIATGEGWRVVDIVCTYGPGDRPFEEHFLATSISLVLAGNFLCRTSRGSGLMTPGALMLGNPGYAFECSHQHGEGDRCLSFQFEPDLFERIAHDAGAKQATLGRDRLPPLRELAALSTQARIAASSLAQGISTLGKSLEEIALDLAEAVIPIASNVPAGRSDETRHAGRIAQLLRKMEAGSEQVLTTADLGREAGLSRYHFLRSFKRITGITPHQWLLRARLRHAAERLVASRAPITEIALDVGFDDLSNFIRTFHAEFGVSPTRYRAGK
jgi:AraC family transcriptional regulator